MSTFQPTTSPLPLLFRDGVAYIISSNGLGPKLTVNVSVAYTYDATKKAELIYQLRHALVTIHAPLLDSGDNDAEAMNGRMTLVMTDSGSMDVIIDRYTVICKAASSSTRYSVCDCVHCRQLLKGFFAQILSAPHIDDPWEIVLDLVARAMTDRLTGTSEAFASINLSSPLCN